MGTKLARPRTLEEALGRLEALVLSHVDVSRLLEGLSCVQPATRGLLYAQSVAFHDELRRVLPPMQSRGILSMTEALCGWIAGAQHQAEAIPVLQRELSRSAFIDQRVWPLFREYVTLLRTACSGHDRDRERWAAFKQRCRQTLHEMDEQIDSDDSSTYHDGWPPWRFQRLRAQSFRAVLSHVEECPGSLSMREGWARLSRMPGLLVFDPEVWPPELFQIHRNIVALCRRLKQATPRRYRSQERQRSREQQRPSSAPPPRGGAAPRYRRARTQRSENNMPVGPRPSSAPAPAAFSWDRWDRIRDGCRRIAFWLNAPEQAEDLVERFQRVVAAERQKSFLLAVRSCHEYEQVARLLGTDWLGTEKNHWRQLCLRTHPDKAPECEEVFKIVNGVWQHLQTLQAVIR